MRLRRFLNEEDMIKKALAIDEPEVNNEYTEEEIAANKEILQIAIGKQTEILSKLRKGSNNDDQLDAARAIMADLKDKEEKWDNPEKETKSQGPNPPEAMGGGMEEEPAEEPTKEEEEEEPEEEEK